jgi:nucleotide-binding universal stress UspA family protein
VSAAAPGARLDAWTAGVRAGTPSAPPVKCVVVAGLPAVELARFAERQGARLLVLGAKERTRLERLYFGDTGDGVVRRSRVPCLFIPRAAALEGGVLVALDGTDRGLPVFAAASEFARDTGQPLRAVTVEPRWPGEPPALAAAMPAGRSERLRAMLAASRRADGGASYTGDLAVRRGEPASEILAERERTRAAVLAVGYRLGGPSAAVETGSVSRRVVHQAPCAVLTVPL